MNDYEIIFRHTPCEPFTLHVYPTLNYSPVVPWHFPSMLNFQFHLLPPNIISEPPFPCFYISNLEEKNKEYMFFLIQWLSLFIFALLLHMLFSSPPHVLGVTTNIVFGTHLLMGDFTSAILLGNMVATAMTMHFNYCPMISKAILGLISVDTYMA